MTGTKKRVKMTILDFEGKFMLFSKWGKWVCCWNRGSTVTSHLPIVSTVKSNLEFNFVRLSLRSSVTRFSQDWSITFFVWS